MNGEVGEKDPDPPPLLGRRTLNVWGVVGLSMPKLLMFTPREEIIEAHRVNLTLQVRGSERDPLDVLKVGNVLSARLYRTNIGSGKVIPLPAGVMTPLFLLRNWSLRFR
jgi:acetoacetate decarboxylase